MPGVTFRKRRVLRKRRPRRSIITRSTVKRLIGAELKKRDLGVDFNEVPTITGMMTHISGIDQGDTNITRNGNWIRPVVLNGKVVCIGNSSNAVFATKMRVGVLLWKNDFTVDVPTITKVISDTSNPLSPFSLINKGSFSILWTRNIVLSNDKSNPNAQQQLTFYLKLSKYPKTLFAGTAAADSKKYHYFFFALSDEETKANPPSLSFHTSLRYTDS